MEPRLKNVLICIAVLALIIIHHFDVRIQTVAERGAERENECIVQYITLHHNERPMDQLISVAQHSDECTQGDRTIFSRMKVEMKNFDTVGIFIDVALLGFATAVTTGLMKKKNRK